MVSDRSDLDFPKLASELELPSGREDDYRLGSANIGSEGRLTSARAKFSQSYQVKGNALLTAKRQSMAMRNSLSRAFISTSSTPPTLAYLELVAKLSESALLPQHIALIRKRCTVREVIVR